MLTHAPRRRGLIPFECPVATLWSSACVGRTSPMDICTAGFMQHIPLSRTLTRNGRSRRLQLAVSL